MIGEEFREITDNASELESLPLEYAKAIRKSSALDGFTPEKKKEAMGFIRAWMEFIDKNKVDSKKPFAVRYAITRFAKEQMGEQTESNVGVESVDIKNLKMGDQSYIDLLAIDKEVFSDPDVVIGATGNNILNEVDIKKISSKKKIYLISVSSSDREFSVSSFRSKQTIHDDVIYNNITFVNNGFPISFKGNRFELTALEFEKTLCLLTGSVLYGLTKTYTEKGLVDVPKELENMIT